MARLYTCVSPVFVALGAGCPSQSADQGVASRMRRPQPRSPADRHGIIFRILQVCAPRKASLGCLPLFRGAGGAEGAWARQRIAVDQGLRARKASEAAVVTPEPFLAGCIDQEIFARSAAAASPTLSAL